MKSPPPVLVASQSEWPEVLNALLEDAHQKRVSIDQPRVYCLGRGIDAEYYWQVTATPETLGLMKDRWTLHAVDAAHAMVSRFWERLPSEWSELRRDRDTEFLISANWMAGEKGHLYLVMHDKDRGLLVVRYYYNF